mgnify:CR=1 FL=1
MEYNQIREVAKEILTPTCLVCRECNGVACRGQVPGVGGKGTGNSFIRNYDFLTRVKVVMDTIYEHGDQDTEVEFFGHDFAAPIFVAPIGGMDVNYKNLITEAEYTDRVVKGAVAAGIAAFTGDGANDDYFNAPLAAIADVKGMAIPTLKPWKQENVINKIRIIEDLNVPAFAMDIDSAGLTHLAKSGKPVYSKTVDDFREIVQSTDLPFIIKGVMSVEGAIKAADSGCYGIVVSNHGGRCLDNTLATCEVLHSISLAVGDRVKIFVDGGIRTGADVFKALALGADGVLIGRTFTIMAFGGGIDGVELYANKLIAELKDTMLMTGCKSIKDITYDKVVVVK